MRSRLRHPMFWIVVAEVAVMFALFAISWRIYAAHQPPVPVAADLTAAASPRPGPREPAARPIAALPSSHPPSPAPGRRAAIGLPADLVQLNRDQAALERAEDAVLIAAVAACRDYLERVVVPAVRRAESVRTATTPAATQSPAATTKMP